MPSGEIANGADNIAGSGIEQGAGTQAGEHGAPHRRRIDDDRLDPRARSVRNTPTPIGPAP